MRGKDAFNRRPLVSSGQIGLRLAPRRLAGGDARRLAAEPVQEPVGRRVSWPAVWRPALSQPATCGVSAGFRRVVPW